MQLGFAGQAALNESGPSYGIQEEMAGQRMQQGWGHAGTTNMSLAEQVQDWIRLQEGN